MIKKSIVPKSLPASFYECDTKKVARELLGKRLCHLKDGQLTCGIIIETEAYLGILDPACHTYKGRRTPRVESMYLPGGHSYVYLIYGLYFCFNVVTQNIRRPEAVLIRALWPEHGIEVMKSRRKNNADKNLCSGPGKLCQSMGFNRSADGLSLQGPVVWIEDAYSYLTFKKNIQKNPRVGIGYAGDAKDWPLRFSINPDVFN